MLNTIRIAIKQKGQGIIEYAVLLAFIVGLATMLNGTGISGEVKNTFDSVVSLLKGEEQNAYLAGLKKWGKATEFTPETQAERLAIDQLGLENLAGFFLNKDRSYIKSLTKNNNLDGTSNRGLLLGHFGYDGSNSLFVSTDSNDQLKTTETHVFNWMQGDYGTYDAETKTVSDYKGLTYDTSYRQLVSDYPVQNPYRGEDGTGPANGNDARGGLKVKLKYENDKVVAARVVIDSMSQTKKVGNLENASQGLEVTVYSDGTKELTSGFKDFPK